MIHILLSLFVVAFLLNFVWEVWHSQLYTTCLQMPLHNLIQLLTLQSLKDALWITLSYWVSTLIFGVGIFTNLQLIVLAAWLLFFAWIVELHAIQTKRWEYAPTMPRIMGVGLTPVLELAVTGVLAVTLLNVLG